MCQPCTSPRTTCPVRSTTATAPRSSSSHGVRGVRLLGMKLSLDSEQVKSEEALAEKVNKQVAAMRTAPSGSVKGVSASDIDASTAVLAKTFDDQGLLRLDGASPRDRRRPGRGERDAGPRAARAGTGGLPSESFGNVYRKGNRYDLKLP